MFECSRLVVWCLWSVQFEWDVLPAGPELKPLQWNQMVLLERLGLLTEVHCHDDPTSRLYRLPLNWHTKVDLTGREILPDNSNKTKNKHSQGNQSTSWTHFYILLERHILCIFMCLKIWIQWVVASCEICCEIWTVKMTKIYSEITFVCDIYRELYV